MEPDSTTFDADDSIPSKIETFPFRTGQCNLSLYMDLVNDSGQGLVEMQVIERLQAFGLLPMLMECPQSEPTCEVVCKTARVVDRVQWVCKSCKKRQSIRSGSFFLKLQCSIVQVLQMILAWCEDADIKVAAEYFDVKPRVAISIYEKLDEMAAAEITVSKLGGEDSVVLTEMYPECLNRLSPDTTVQPHIHPILMLADTKHVPTQYRLHVMKEHLKRKPNNPNTEYINSEVQQILEKIIEPSSFRVSGSTLSPLDDAHTLSQLTQHCDIEMQRFLTNRIWSQALSLCNASRDLCKGMPSILCAAQVQRYLDVSLYRLRYGDGFFEHMLNIIAERYTEKCDVSMEE